MPPRGPHSQEGRSIAIYLHSIYSVILSFSPAVFACPQLKEAKERHREARTAKKDAEKLLADPPAPCKLSVRAAGEALDKRGRSVLSVATLDQLLDYSDEDTR